MWRRRSPVRDPATGPGNLRRLCSIIASILTQGWQGRQQYPAWGQPPPAVQRRKPWAKPRPRYECKDGPTENRDELRSPGQPGVAVLTLCSTVRRKLLQVCGQKRPFALRRGHEDLRHGQHSIQRICQAGGKFGSQQVDIQLQIAPAVDTVADEGTAGPVGTDRK